MFGKKDKLETFKHLGASTGVQLISEKIIYVEGTSDKEILQTLYSDYTDILSFIEAKGVRTINELTHAIGSMLDTASKYESFLMLRHRDFLSEDERNKINNKYSNRVYIWERRCLENYLLDNKSLASVFNSLGIPEFATEAEVKIILNDIANELRHLTTAEFIEYRINGIIRNITFGGISNNAKMTKEQILNTIKEQRDNLNDRMIDSKIEEIVSDSLKYIDAKWGSAWIDLCNGKKVLQRLINNHLIPRGKKLNISTLRALIVSEMKKSMIYPKEIDTIIKSHIQHNKNGF
jgi:hypothetical protein